MADKDKAQSDPKPAADTQQAQEGAAVQDLPPNHPEDRTETTLTQNAEPDEDLQAQAIADRIGGDHIASRERGRR